VIINDYGNAIFDADTLRDEASSVEDVSGSCVCCDSLDALLLALEGVKPQGPAVILLEANGTTDVPSLLEVLAISRSTRHCTPPIQVAAVDADNWQQRDFNNALELEQVCVASYIVLTWQDTCTPERLAEVRADLRRLNPRHREVTPEELSSRLALLALTSDLAAAPAATPKIDLSAPRQILTATRHQHHDHNDRYHFSAIEVILPATLQKEALLESLSTLPPNVLRAKGMVCFPEAPDSSFLAQKASPMAPTTPMQLPRVKQPASMMVFIGAALDEDRLRDHLAQLTMVI
jgi:G3E family GTPase